MVEQVPVKEGEICNVKIYSVGEKGDGIAKINGFILFVPGTKKGDYVKVQVTKVLAKVGFVKVLEKLEKPVRTNKFVQISKEELEDEQVEHHSDIEDTEDFGADFDDED